MPGYSEREAGAGDDVFSAPDTLLAVVQKGKDPVYRSLPLRGHLHLAELRERTPYIDRVMLDLQDALNTASTEERIVNDDAGFPIRLLLGAMPAGNWSGKKGEDGRTVWKFEEQPLKLKPSSVVHVQGQMTPDAEATAKAGAVVAKSVGSPSVGQFEAADPKNYRDERAGRRLSLLRRGRQLYVETTGDAAVSGASRIQALHDHLVDAIAFARSLGETLTTAVEIAWDTACYLADVPARDYDLALTVTCQVTPPRMTPEEANAVLRLFAEKIWSRERTMRYTGVQNPEDERQQIDREQAEALAEIEAALARGVPVPDDDDDEGDE